MTIRRFSLAALVLSGCAVDLEVPPTALVRCTGPNHCPAGTICVLDLGMCASDDDPCVVVAGGVGSPAPDGNKCALAGSGDGICLGGQCVESTCGDGFTNPATEECDDGANNNIFEPDACRSITCELPKCGDSVMDTSEVCDDGNATSGDGCRGDCGKIEICGDSAVDTGEVCDDGNATSGDGCRGDCGKIEICGDGALDQGEACDDANMMSGDGCRGDCGKIETCGDTELDQGEACDDGNDDPNDGCADCSSTEWTVSVLVGGGGESLSPSRFALFYPNGVAVGRAGVVYLTDTSHRIFRIDRAADRVTVYAGTGKFGYSGDGGAATDAQLWGPSGLALDARGNLFVAEPSNHRIRRIDADSGVITTAAGTGTACASSTAACGDGGAATAGQLKYPAGVALDPNGNLYVADTHDHRIRRVDARTGIITTVAGTGATCASLGACGDAAAATAAQLYYPERVAVGPDGRVFIADSIDHRVRAFDPSLATPVIDTVAGVESQWCPTTPVSDCGDGGAANAATLQYPVGLAFDSSGNLYVATKRNHRVRKVAGAVASGTITTVAGSGNECASPAASCGDGGAATLASLNEPKGIGIDENGNLLLADSNTARLRIVSPSGSIATLAGVGHQGYRGDGGAALAATFEMPRDLAVDPGGNIYITDDWGAAVRQVTAQSGVVTTFAGVGAACPTTGSACGDQVPATEALLSSPMPVATDSAGNVYIGERNPRLVRKVDALTGEITTLAGDGSVCDQPTAVDACGDGGPARDASLGLVIGLAFHGGALYVGQAGSQRVRKIDLGATPPVITTVVGDGTPCADPTAIPACGDGGSPTAAQVSFPAGLAFDGDDLYIADSGTYLIRKVDLGSMTPTISAVAGTGNTCSSVGYCGDGGAAQAADMNVRDLVVSNGVVYFTDYSGAVRKVSGGVVDLVAGGGNDYTDIGDGNSLAGAYINGPEGLAIDADGRLVLVEAGGYRVRALDLVQDRVTSLTSVDPIGDGPFAVSRLGGPAALLAAPDASHWLVADGGSGRLRRIDLVRELVETVAGYPSSRTEATDLRARYRALLARAVGLAYDPARRRVYVSIQEDQTIARLDLVSADDPETWTLTTVAGASGARGYLDDPTDPLGSRFDGPAGLAFDSERDTLWVTETGNHLLRRIDLTSGATETAAGEAGVDAFFGDGVDASTALLSRPSAVAIATDGSVYLSDTGNHRVRRIDASGTIRTVLGDGSPASSGQGSPAESFSVDTPRGLALDSHGNLFVASRQVVRLVVAGDDGIADGKDPVLSIYGQAPRDTFPSSVTRCLSDVALLPGEDVALVADACTGMILELTRAALPTP